MTTTFEAEPPGGELRVLASSYCGASACPTIYQRDESTLLVQGYVAHSNQTGIAPPDGEGLVEIPIQLLLSAAKAIL